jgi:hypothetical protein
MSVNEIQALAQQFADAFDRRDIKTVLEMLSEDVEVFDHVPYRFDGKPVFTKYLNEAIEGVVSTSFGFRQPSCRIYNDTVGIVNAYDMFMGALAVLQTLWARALGGLSGDASNCNEDCRHSNLNSYPAIAGASGRTGCAVRFSHRPLCRASRVAVVLVTYGAVV